MTGLEVTSVTPEAGVPRSAGVRRAGPESGWHAVTILASPLIRANLRQELVSARVLFAGSWVANIMSYFQSTNF
jgi:hypothetical protein